MKFNYKSKTGFTLIELLVVIGILAVLAAIAIPSVAGLIDRANISADKTNATEMTNAVERFTSEYELYKQDLSNGTLDTTNLDASNSRVFNVTGITSRADVEKFESTGIEGKGINIDTKYPANEDTIKAVVKNYMKTTSSTFEPKQSDMAYYYSPEAGVVAVVKEGSTITEITDIALTNESTFKVANTIGDGTTAYQWINLSMNESLESSTDVNVATNDKKVYTTLQTKVEKAKELYNHDAPELNPNDGSTPVDGETHETTSYIYTFHSDIDGWSVKSRNTYFVDFELKPIYTSLNGKYIKSLYRCFAECVEICTSPVIPNHVENMDSAFSRCTMLRTAPEIPSSVTNMQKTFTNCTSLTTAPVIPNSVTNMEETFVNCESLVNASSIPNSVTNMKSTFNCCKKLVTAPDMSKATGINIMESTFANCYLLKNVNSLPSNVKILNATFYMCRALETTPIFPDSVTDMKSAFSYCYSLKNVKPFPNKLNSLYKTFENCTSLESVPSLPNTVVSLNTTFTNCTSLTTAPVIPNDVTNVESTFSGCTSLETAPIIPTKVMFMSSMFKNCTSLKGDITVNIDVHKYAVSENCLKNCAQDADHAITIKGSCNQNLKQSITKTAYNDGEFVTVE